jgi:hypothetical protein
MKGKKYPFPCTLKLIIMSLEVSMSLNMPSSFVVNPDPHSVANRSVIINMSSEDVTHVDKPSDKVQKT